MLKVLLGCGTVRGIDSDHRTKRRSNLAKSTRCRERKLSPSSGTEKKAADLARNTRKTKVVNQTEQQLRDVVAPHAYQK